MYLPGVIGSVVHVHVHIEMWLRGVVCQSVSRAVCSGLRRSGSGKQGRLVEGSFRENGRWSGECSIGSGGRQTYRKRQRYACVRCVYSPPQVKCCQAYESTEHAAQLSLDKLQKLS